MPEVEEQAQNRKRIYRPNLHTGQKLAVFYKLLYSFQFLCLFSLKYKWIAKPKELKKQFESNT